MNVRIVRAATPNRTDLYSGVGRVVCSDDDTITLLFYDHVGHTSPVLLRRGAVEILLDEDGSGDL